MFIEVETPESVQTFVSARPDQEITIFLKRAKTEHSITVIPTSGIIEGTPAIGISMVIGAVWYAWKG